MWDGTSTTSFSILIKSQRMKLFAARAKGRLRLWYQEGRSIRQLCAQRLSLEKQRFLEKKSQHVTIWNSRDPVVTSQAHLAPKTATIVIDSNIAKPEVWQHGSHGTFKMTRWPFRWEWFPLTRNFLALDHAVRLNTLDVQRGIHKLLVRAGPHDLPNPWDSSYPTSKVNVPVETGIWGSTSYPTLMTSKRLPHHWEPV